MGQSTSLAIPTFTFPLQIPSPGLKHLGHISKETAHAGTGNEGAGEGGSGQTDTGAQEKRLWETKEHRSHLDALVLLQTARVWSLGKGPAVRDPSAKLAAGPIPPAPSPIPMGKLCLHPVLGDARGRLRMDREGGRGEGISWAQQDPVWETNRLSQAGQSASSVM